MKSRILTAFGILVLICAVWLGSRNMSVDHGRSMTRDLPTKVLERDSAESKRSAHSDAPKSARSQNKSTQLGSKAPWSSPSAAPDRNVTVADGLHTSSSLSKSKRPLFSRPSSGTQPSPQHPAAWVDLGAGVNAPAGFEEAIQEEAERLHEEISQIDEADIAAQNTAISRSDQLLRQRYGGWIWMQHHIQAHHLSVSQSAR